VKRSPWRSGALWGGDDLGHLARSMAASCAGSPSFTFTYLGTARDEAQVLRSRLERTGVQPDDVVTRCGRGKGALVVVESRGCSESSVQAYLDISGPLKM
jgi:hypothetical protein